MLKTLEQIDWSPLLISMKTGIIATIISFFFGIYMAKVLMYMNPKIKCIADTILTLPLVLPPTVMGFLMLVVFSLKRPFGKFLFREYGIKIVLSWQGCVVAAVFIAFPLMYRNARAAFEQIDVNLIFAAQTLGMSNNTIFWKVILPSAKPGIVSGVVLTFARAIGEYGATTMLAGNIVGKTQTMSIAIAAHVRAGNYTIAGCWVAILLLVSFLMVFLISIVSEKSQKHNTRW